MTLAAPIPARAPLIPIRRKLLPLVIIMILHGLDEDGALRLAEDGTLWPAWDLAVLPGKKNVRVWRGAVENYKPGLSPSARTSLESIIAESLPPIGITPAGSAAVGGAELNFRWCCSRQTVVRLMRSGELRQAGSRTGKSTYRISRQSVVEFLQRRVLT